MVDLPELKIKKTTYQEKRKETKKMQKDIKISIETQKNDTAVLRAFGTDISLNKRNQLRMIESFETLSECQERSKQVLKKNHVGNILTPWREDECIGYLNSLPDGHLISFKSLAEEYGIVNKNLTSPANGGQVLKEFLKKRGIDTERFNYRGKSNSNEPRLRRRKRKLDFLHNVSFPCDMTNEKVKQNLTEKILDGTYTAGDLIVPQKFRKISCKDGEPNVEEFTVSGRKISLELIRKKHYIKYEKYYRLFSEDDVNNFTRGDLVRELDRINELKDEYLNLETACLMDKFKSFNGTRNLQFWHDGSCIANHSHLLMAVNILYDKAIFYTDEEFEASNGNKIDIQSEIESPFLYIVARCPSDDHQLLYSDSRNEDIRHLKDPIIFGQYKLHDTVRFFHGDGPACETEAGQQKNGHYPCWLCPAHFKKGNKLEYLISLPHLDLQDRCTKILDSVASEDKIASSITMLYSKLKVHEIVDELHQRRIKFSIDEKKESLSQKLVSEMHGMQRLPSLINSDRNLLFTFLSNYEILGCEPLHDVKQHIDNLYAELPSHLSKTEKKIMEDTILNSFSQKELKRGVDYRRSLVYLNSKLNGKIDKTIFGILSTLCEIQRILYGEEREREQLKMF